MEPEWSLADDGKRNEVQRSEWTVVLALLLAEKLEIGEGSGEGRVKNRA